MAAGDQACRQEQWLLLAELSGFLEGVASCPGPGPSAAQTFSWLGVMATPRAKCSLPALGTGRLSQPLTSGCSPGSGHMPLLPIPHILLEKSGMSLSPLPTVNLSRLC